MRYLGIDYGARFIGIAVSDDTGHLAFPKCTIENTNTGVVRAVAELCKSEMVNHVVIGESVDRAGKRNPIAHHAQMFGDALHVLTGIPVSFEWEGYSSAQARSVRVADERMLGAPRGNIARKVKKTQARVDAHAAQIILQSFLDKHSKNP